ncbi:DUF1800 domain-containing protein [Crocinitomix algicola]|uniref:DUF1800 domain-containing protein n=1 Tax=Crocinitomix algicola TaxID=1740263 RepID=UPI000872F123|nr:DUF1800 domain-containing protein [Crocinitomix algicola]
MKYTQTFAFILFIFAGYSQNNNQYLGGGNSDGITVSTSSNSQLYDGVFKATGAKTVDGSGLIAKKMEAVRFLAQATFGGSAELTDHVVNIGINDWLIEQYEAEPNYLGNATQEVYNTILATHIAEGGDSSDFSIRPNSAHVDYAWWDNIMRGKDLLRQRMAYALSEIFVISLESNIGGYGLAVATYYDLLIKNAFGNYRDLIEDITRNPAMGVYLSHLNNAKTDLENNTNPDENYAREIMQLFSIGLHELNQDGTLKLSETGQPIPTYDNEDIKEFAKVFTGLGIGARRDTIEPEFWHSLYFADVTVPMKMYDEYHEPGEKKLLNGYIIPEGQTGDQDLTNTLDHLFHHNNVGPFISSRLIQHFVKSNPSPQYIEDISAIFENNGNGVRGDLWAVLKGILLHPEARDCDWLNDPSQGKLREPIIRYTTVARHFGGYSPYEGRFWNHSWSFLNDVDQHPLHAPTVFNFFTPDYSPNGQIADAGMVGPEFQLHNSRTGINYANRVYYWIEYEYLLACSSNDVPEGVSNITETNITSLFEYSKDADALLDQLDLFLCHGQLSDRTRNIIKEAINEFPVTSSGLTSRIELAAYLILVSPDYNILK